MATELLAPPDGAEPDGAIMPVVEVGPPGPVVVNPSLFDTDEDGLVVTTVTRVVVRSVICAVESFVAMVVTSVVVYAVGRSGVRTPLVRVPTAVIVSSMELGDRGPGEEAFHGGAIEDGSPEDGSPEDGTSEDGRLDGGSSEADGPAEAEVDSEMLAEIGPEDTLLDVDGIGGIPPDNDAFPGGTPSVGQPEGGKLDDGATGGDSVDSEAPPGLCRPLAKRLGSAKVAFNSFHGP